ncbi:MAG TPA: hypothetical protein PK079_08015 [Leptospiraceae bacterium]|nr:hypothetical protein [Leptospiraceae bacterium]HMZ64188.1 hypothetical protein [Leptospiraceae bacterium]HNC00356.1 hypothetical protein [Leptospiraceae bacterium]HNE09030.1 hypothetical protein [Leptospiraceae bacterium]HNE53104.1 hypothetical protein [Leptospiraceae bacterium]
MKERTEYFEDTVDYSRRETVISFREVFEKKESTYPKKDHTIYNCPFLGYINKDFTRIGCMIHPIRTGDPKSQNFSFYGSSICQTYDCRNKDRKNGMDWEDYFNSLKLDFYDYSHLASDHILITRLESFFDSLQIPLKDIFLKHSPLLKRIFQYKVNQMNHLTSFEIDMNSNTGTPFERLIEILSLEPDHPLYLELKLFCKE